MAYDDVKIPFTERKIDREWLFKTHFAEGLL